MWFVREMNVKEGSGRPVLGALREYLAIARRKFPKANAKLLRGPFTGSDKVYWVEECKSMAESEQTVKSLLGGRGNEEGNQASGTAAKGAWNPENVFSLSRLFHLGCFGERAQVGVLRSNSSSPGNQPQGRMVSAVELYVVIPSPRSIASMRIG